MSDVQETKPVPELGTKAPTFSLPDAEGITVRLSDYTERWVVVYFYPKADTPGCTTEAAEFSGATDEFEKAGAVIFGISPDPAEKLAKFRDKHGITIALLSDESRTVIEKYGAWQLKKNYGRESWGVQRSTFLIEPGGKVSHVWPKVRVKGHVEAVLKTLQEIQGERA